VHCAHLDGMLTCYIWQRVFDMGSLSRTLSQFWSASMLLLIDSCRSAPQGSSCRSALVLVAS
jgi:hypothetical protein